MYKKVFVFDGIGDGEQFFSVVNNGVVVGINFFIVSEYFLGIVDQDCFEDVYYLLELVEELYICKDYYCVEDQCFEDILEQYVVLELVGNVEVFENKCYYEDIVYVQG